MRGILIATIIIAVVTGVAFSLSNAFFSDTETSTDNHFQAGSLDLKISNISFYNGHPNPSTSWPESDLSTQKFFDFVNIKPGDWGTDLISFRVDNNHAWGCYDVTLTRNDDHTCTDAERIDEPACNEPNQDLFDGQLADAVQISLWLDDGNNRYDTGETIIAQGNIKQAIPKLQGALADSQGGILNLNQQPMAGSHQYHLAKAWCFGTLTLQPGQDILCNGSGLNNATQTDQVMADISFSVIQSRNNPNYLCSIDQPTPSITPSPVLLETLLLDSHNPLGSTSTHTLELGKNYQITVNGTWLNRNGHDTVDADFVSYDNFATYMDGDATWTVFGLTDYAHLLDTQVNNTFIDWGSYSSSHSYSTIIGGQNSPVTLRIFDGVPETNTQNLGWYDDNSGSLNVTIYELP